MKRANWKALIYVLGCAALISCGSPGAPIPPSLELPKPVTDLRAARKGDRVYLAWTVPAKTADRQSVRHLGPTQVCRSLKAELGDCKNPVAEIPAKQFPLPSSQSARKGTTAPRVQANYTDTLPRELQKQDPTAAITYAVSVLNESGRSAGLSNQVQIPSAPTLPPPEHFNGKVGRDGVLLSWGCPPAVAAGEADRALGHKLRIYRREQGKQVDTKVSDVNFEDCSPAQSGGQTSEKSSHQQFLDQTFEWEKRYDYRAAVVTVASVPGKPEDEVESDDTPAIQVFAHDVFPPEVPTGLQAVFSGVGQKPFVDLVWSPDSEADLAGYNLFRREEGGQRIKLNSQPVKTSAYRDTDVQSGKRYFYSVSALDERNNESTQSEEASEQVP